MKVTKNLYRVFIKSTLISSALLLSSVNATAEIYTFNELGTLGGLNSSARDINNSGQVVGSSVTSSGLQHAVSWQNGNLTDIGLGQPNQNSEAVAINNAGQIAGSMTADVVVTPFIPPSTVLPSYTLSRSATLPYKWENSSSAGTYLMGGPVLSTTQDQLGNFRTARATAIDEIGNVVAFGNNSGVRVLDSFVNGTFYFTTTGQVIRDPRQTYALTNFGQYGSGVYELGLMSTPHSPTNASDGTTLGAVTRQIRPLPNNQNFFINVDFLVGIGSNKHATLWQNNSLAATDLGTLAGGTSQANAINTFMQIVGNSDGSAFIWENGVMTDLNTLVNLSLNIKLITANSINDLGWIVGDLFDSDTNTTRGYVLALNPPSSVPVPAAAWLFASGLGALGVAKRRSKKLS